MGIHRVFVSSDHHKSLITALMTDIISDHITRSSFSIAKVVNHTLEDV